MEYFLASVVLFRAWMFWTPLEFVKKLKLSSKYLLLCSVEERKSYDFETEGWVNWHNLHFWNTSWLFHVMHTFLHVLLGIWQTFGRVQRIRRLWFVSYTYVFFQTDRLCCSFVQVEGYTSFWVSVTSAVSRYLCVCELIVFECCFRVFFEGRSGTEWCDEQKRLADTQRGFSLCSASAGEVRGHPHTDVKHRRADRHKAHTNKPL